MLKALLISSLVVLALPAAASAQQMAARAMMVNGTPHVSGTEAAATPVSTGGSFKDEYGNLYNSRGDRIDRNGRLLSPPRTARAMH
jgi:hypothetical protein